MALAAALAAAVAAASWQDLALTTLWAAVMAAALYLGNRAGAWNRARRLLAALPSPPACSLLAGHADHFFKPDFPRKMLEWHEQLGGIYYVRIFNQLNVVVTDPKLIHELFARGEGQVKDRMRSTMRQWDPMFNAQGKPNILTASTADPHWLTVRKGVAPAFNPANLRKAFAVTVEAGAKVVAALKAAGPDAPVDVDNAMQREALDVIGQFGFGKAYNASASLDTPAGAVDPFLLSANCLREVITRMTNPLRAPLSWLWPAAKQGDRDFAAFRAAMWDLYNEVTARGPVAPEDTSIAAHILRLRDPATGGPLPADRLVAEFGAMFTAGLDTTAHSMAWTLYLVSQHPEVEAKMLAELDGLGLAVTAQRPQPRQLEYADLSRLPYLTMVFKESMRIQPVVDAGLNRCLLKDIQLGGYRIPAGTLVWVVIRALHCSSHYWPQADKFMPERWEQADAQYAEGTGGAAAADSSPDGVAGGVADREDDKTRPKRFLPFGEGVRNCVGQSLAKMNAVATLAMLYSQCSFRLAPRMGGPAGVRACEINRITLQPQGGLWMTCHPRPL